MSAFPYQFQGVLREVELNVGQASDLRELYNQVFLPRMQVITSKIWNILNMFDQLLVRSRKASEVLF